MCVPRVQENGVWPAARPPGGPATAGTSCTLPQQKAGIYIARRGCLVLTSIPLSAVPEYIYFQFAQRRSTSSSGASPSASPAKVCGTLLAAKSDINQLSTVCLCCTFGGGVGLGAIFLGCRLHTCSLCVRTAPPLTDLWPVLALPCPSALHRCGGRTVELCMDRGL